MALIETSFDGFFLKAAQALQPYLDHVVFIGGCANALYRHHPSANQAAMRPLTADMIYPAIDRFLAAIENGLTARGCQ
jgi:hypothetical protein